MTELRDVPMLGDIINCYSLTHFFETGCYKGAGIQTAVEVGFDTITSCDISKYWINVCEQKFATAKNLTIHCGESHDVLAKCELRPYTLFWLDAHLPGVYHSGYPENSANKMPVLHELQAIKHSPCRHSSVILCDDVSLYVSDDNILYRLRKNFHNHEVHGFTLQQLYDVLCETHHMHVITVNEGLLMFTPKM